MSTPRRRIAIRWTCSDYVSHSHRWRWSAWLCGRVQWLAGVLARAMQDEVRP
jgi:hypothetical protein